MREIELTQDIVLRSDRSVFLRDLTALLIADAHFGKEATFRRAGIPLPEGRSQMDFQRIEAALNETGADHLIFLGDFVHSEEAMSADAFENLLCWCSFTAAEQITLVKGNHDRIQHAEAEKLGISIHREPWVIGHYLFAHFPQVIKRQDLAEHEYAFAGHLHPGLKLREHRRSGGGIRMPAFVVRDRRTILPAFGEFTGLAEIEPIPGEQYYLVAEGALVPYRP